MSDVLEAQPPDVSPQDAEAPRPLFDIRQPEDPQRLSREPGPHTPLDPEPLHTTHQDRLIAELTRLQNDGQAEKAPDTPSEYVPSPLEVKNPEIIMPTTRFERAVHKGASLLKPLALGGAAILAFLVMMIKSAARETGGGRH